jgi:hypothetical protein
MLRQPLFRFLFDAHLSGQRHPPVEFLFGAPAGIAILLLEQSDELVEVTGDPIQVVGGDATRAPPVSDLTPQLHPLAFEFTLIHGVSLLILRVSCPS